MKKIYLVTARALAVFGGFVAIGAGAMIVGTALILGGMMALAAKLALKGTSPDPELSEDIRMEAAQPQT
ncbi:hypothetical protein GGR95_003774 [Sulfitobacter undariae]|uniref:Uncharacterized protein n=1 Tax=Sulfitobacter undariae TaxID=1563671 RepID=A0A7W6H1P0_9RHOB|nr:hypothetical protein [Sulfitobacter undariae]MBB3996106.1 hypothetical protein [Sulfitobacter undariae]